MSLCRPRSQASEVIIQRSLRAGLSPSPCESITHVIHELELFPTIGYIGCVSVSNQSRTVQWERTTEGLSVNSIYIHFTISHFKTPFNLIASFLIVPCRISPRVASITTPSQPHQVMGSYFEGWKGRPALGRGRRFGVARRLGSSGVVPAQRGVGGIIGDLTGWVV